jgi:ubiquinone/menaquinone biosynthesis C-methylase UbiE
MTARAEAGPVEAGRRLYADVESSTEEYARRFAGPVGEWFLETQWLAARRLLAGVGPGARVLDVGGGHAQLVPGLVAAGFDVTVVGSDVSCAARLAPWLVAGRCRFQGGDLLALPFAGGDFEAALSVRLLPHLDDWERLIAELCRVAARMVIVDYPSRRSVNAWADRLFALKSRVEGNTRPFRVFHPAQIAEAFARHGFRATASVPQFLLPMALHRFLTWRGLSQALEGLGETAGLRGRFGSPVIVRAERLDPSGSLEA